MNHRFVSPSLLLPALTAGALLGAPLISVRAEVRLVEAFGHLEFQRPIALAIPPDGSGREFVVEQRGVVSILPEDRGEGDAEVFLDISDRELDSRPGKFSEEGLMGIAFHPDFAENKKLYLSYTIQGPKRSVLSEVVVGADGKPDLEGERVLLEVLQPFWNHNSGNLIFGADGMLYMAFGDGGKRDDFRRLAQNPFLLNGKIIRIDVDGTAGSLGYGIPDDNPFVGAEGTRPEIWALGLRNPWGLWFDEEGRLWVADVGQDLYEEIHIVEGGKNYGWSHRDGFEDFVARTDEPEEGTEFADPIHVYNHTVGVSITGGYVYRGEELPSLVGQYLFGDFGRGRLFTIDGGGGLAEDRTDLYERGEDNAKFQPAGIYPDSDGEPLIFSWGDGKIYTLSE